MSSWRTLELSVGFWLFHLVWPDAPPTERLPATHRRHDPEISARRRQFRRPPRPPDTRHRRPRGACDLPGHDDPVRRLPRHHQQLQRFVHIDPILGVECLYDHLHGTALS